MCVCVCCFCRGDYSMLYLASVVVCVCGVWNVCWFVWAARVSEVQESVWVCVAIGRGGPGPRGVRHGAIRAWGEVVSSGPGASMGCVCIQNPVPRLTFYTICIRFGLQVL